MQMAISTTGRHLLCILCSVYVLSKMLKLCSAEGSSFRFWWMLSAVCCRGSILISVEVHQIGPFVKLLSDFWLMLSAVCCWGSILFLKQQLGVWSLDAVSPLLLKQRPGVSTDSLIVGFCPNFRSPISLCVFTGLWGVTLQSECFEMWLVRWWACSGSNRLCVRFPVSCDPSEFCFWSGPFVMLDPSDTCFLRWVLIDIWSIRCLFLRRVSGWWCQIFVSEAPPLALISQLDCHTCLVPGFTDGAGFCVVTMS